MACVSLPPHTILLGIQVCIAALLDATGDWIVGCCVAVVWLWWGYGTILVVRLRYASRGSGSGVVVVWLKYRSGVLVVLLQYGLWLCDCGMVLVWLLCD